MCRKSHRAGKLRPQLFVWRTAAEVQGTGRWQETVVRRARECSYKEAQALLGSSLSGMCDQNIHNTPRILRMATHLQG